ncbi:MAG: hypothetical protein PHO67_08125 [Candidatus Omnitrophica bacterium]|nr:hypothetical protein [Candidatus Omnitrophota bacterium]
MAKQTGPRIPFSVPGGGGNFLDKYMSADDKLKVVGEQLESLTNYLQELGGEQMTMGRTQEVPFQQILVPGQALRLSVQSPYPGKVRKILRHWPAGCNALVDVAVGIGNKRILPETGFVALNDATPVFDNLNIPVAQEENIWVDMQNGDAINPHTITVTVTVEEDISG